MEFADAHGHLHDPWFKLGELQRVVEEAKESHVNLIISCASFPENYEQVLRSSEIPEIYVTLGIQPTIAPKFKGIDIYNFFSQFLRRTDKIVAIGEVGLDYYWVKDEKERQIQREVFGRIIDAANEFEIPLVIHCRKAETDTLEILRQRADVPVLLHSFDGNLKDAELAIDLGYFATIPTNLRYRKNRQKTAKRFGLDNIMIETDAPFCPPLESIERNEPKYIPIAAEKLANVLGVTVQEVAEKTTRLVKNFHRIP